LGNADWTGRGAPMRQVADRLTQRDMIALAAYAASLAP
jgi:cytochrome c553